MAKLKLIKNSPEYHEFIRKLRNDKRVRGGFIEQGYINKKKHQEYMAKYWQNFYICLRDNEPAGYLGMIDNDIRVAVQPDFQRQGIGLFMVKELKKINKKAFAKVKFENLASRGLFEKAGFKLKYLIYEPD